VTIQSRITTLKADSLGVDHDVQRALVESRVDAMVQTFNPDALGVLTVSHRPDGTYHIVDGQHRWAACTKYGQEYVRCNVYTGLTRQDEAALFRVLNNTKIVNALDRFRVRVVEGEVSAKDIAAIIERAGWRVPLRASQGTPGVINSPVALEWVYNGAGIKQSRQANVFRSTVEVITAAWGYEPDGMRSDVFKGIGAFLTRFEGILDLSKVVRMLQSYPGGPLKLQADASIMRSMRSSPAADSVASILTGLYNKKRSVNRIPEWFSMSPLHKDSGDDTDTEVDAEED
jgi:hypothetical protein